MFCRSWLFLTVLLQHLFFFLAQAVHAPFAYFVEDPVNFLLLAEFTLVVPVINGVMVCMLIEEHVVNKQNMWSCDDQVNEHQCGHRDD